MANKKFDIAALKVSETNALSDVLNDDVDTRGSRSVNPLSLQTGRDTGVWNYTYKKGGPAYEVVSVDPVIDSLTLHGEIVKPMKVDVTLKMFACGRRKPVFKHTWTNLTWSKGTFSELVVAQGDTLDGVGLECIDRFEIQVAVLSSSSFTALQLSQIDFNWEADDIENCKCE